MTIPLNENTSPVNNTPPQNQATNATGGIVGARIPIPLNRPIPQQQKTAPVDKNTERALKSRYIERQRAILSIVYLITIMLNLFVAAVIAPKYKLVVDKQALHQFQFDLIEKTSAIVINQKDKLNSLSERAKNVILKDDDAITIYITNFLKDVFLSNRVQYPSSVFLSQSKDSISSSFSFTAPFDNGFSIIERLEGQLWLTSWGFSPIVDANASNTSVPLYNFQISIGIPISLLAQ